MKMQKYVNLFRGVLTRVSNTSAGLLYLANLKANRYLNFPLFLRRVNVVITSACNLKCKYCPTGRGVIPGRHMEICIFRKSINDIIECINNNIFFSELHLFSGGEPLLHPKLLEILSILAEVKKIKNFPKTAIYTNCTLLSSTKAKEILLSGGLDEISFSIDMGNKEEYESLRVGANFDTVLRNAIGTIDIINKYGLSVKTKLVSIFPKKEKSLIFDPRFLKLANLVDEFAPRFPHNWTGDIDLGFKPDEYRKTQKNKGLCGFIRNNIVILPDGRITPCCADQAGRGAYSHINALTLIKAICSPSREKMIKLMMLNRRQKIPLCRYCEL